MFVQISHTSRRLVLRRQMISTVEEWYRHTQKTADFYDRHAAQRCYFYTIDLQGRLFLEDTIPKNIATSIKDPKFLNFFWRRLKLVDDDDSSTVRQLMEDRGIPTTDYPYVSPCGKEYNFVRPVASPVVFHSLVEDQTLVYAGDLQQEL